MSPSSIVSRSFLTLAMVFLFSSSAHAGLDDIRWENNGVGLSIGGQNLKYGESDETGTLDTEKGWMPNVRLSIDKMIPEHKWYSFFNNFWLHADGGATFGNTKYTGGIQEISGGTVTIIPSTETDNSQIYDINVKLGRGIPIGNQVMLTPYGDLGYRYWVRTLNGVGGYEEDYSDGEAGVGLMGQWSPISRLVLSLSAEGGTTFNPQVHIGIGDGATAKLGDDTVWKGKLKVGYALTKSVEVNSSLQMEGFGFKASGQVPLFEGGQFTGLGLSEPNSYTHETDIMFGLMYHF